MRAATAAALTALAFFAAAVVVGCGATRVVTESHTNGVSMCSGGAGVTRCVADIARLKLRLGGLPPNVAHMRCKEKDPWWYCTFATKDESGIDICVGANVRTTPHQHVPVLVSWGLSPGDCGIT